MQSCRSKIGVKDADARKVYESRTNQDSIEDPEKTILPSGGKKIAELEKRRED